MLLEVAREAIPVLVDALERLLGAVMIVLLLVLCVRAGFGTDFGREALVMNDETDDDRFLEGQAE